MKRIVVEIDDRFVTEWGFVYFGLLPKPDGTLAVVVPPEPFCLPGFKYVIHPEPNRATFSIYDPEGLPKQKEEEVKDGADRQDSTKGN